MLRKAISLIVLLGAVCGSAYATNKVVYKSELYPQRTTIFSSFGYAGRHIASDGYSYEEYFDIISYPLRHQIVYHHPNDYSSDVYEYYLALVEISGNADPYARAFYNGQELPVGTGRHEMLFDKSQNINIFVTRDQLLEAYEGPGKLVLQVVTGNNMYEVVYPHDYLRTVLAYTTDLVEYPQEKVVVTPAVSMGPTVVVVQEVRPAPRPRPRPVPVVRPAHHPKPHPKAQPAPKVPQPAIQKAPQPAVKKEPSRVPPAAKKMPEKPKEIAKPAQKKTEKPTVQTTAPQNPARGKITQAVPKIIGSKK